MSEKQSEYGVIHGYARLAYFVLGLLWTGLLLLVQRPQTLAERSLWRQRMCLRIAAGMGLQIDVIGRVPTTGMLVSNHLSYLDAVVLGSLLPAVFVAKSEVRQWPLVGWLTASGGTIYLKRENVRAAAEVNRLLTAAMAQDLPTVIFPEGTTTGATEPLPFHPALFEPASRNQAPVWPAALAYTIDGSSQGVSEFVCYWGEMTFVKHLVRLMRQQNLRAVVRVAEDPVYAAKRNEIAARSQEAVTRMLQDGMDMPLRAGARTIETQQPAPAQAF